MHTFFINTSNRNFDAYDVLFDVYYASNKLVSKRCPMDRWYDADQGYQACGQDICQMIDGYDVLNDAYNLIVFVDISTVKEYASFARDKMDQANRDLCFDAISILHSHLLQSTLLQQLQTAGKAPQETLLLFGEDKRFYQKTRLPIDFSRQEIRRNLFALLGIPDDETLEKIVKELPADENNHDQVSLFLDRTRQCAMEASFDWMIETYQADLRFWGDELLKSHSLTQAHSNLFKRIDESYSREKKYSNLQSVSCPLDCQAETMNKSALALNTLNLAYYLLTCVNAQSICIDDNHTPRPFEIHSVEELGKLLSEKRAKFKSMCRRLTTTVDSFQKLGLTPPLYALDYQRFGLDPTGENYTDFEEVDEQSSATVESSESAQEDEPPIKRTRRILRVNTQKKRKNLLLERTFHSFREEEEELTALTASESASPQRLIDRAKNIRRHHISYLRKAKLHTDDILSHYAGKSLDNLRPLLSKRNVCGAENGYDDRETIEYRYRNPAKEIDSRPLNAIQTSSEKAYQTVVTNFLSFCAGRSVAVTDVEEQCNWFITKVRQIESALNWMRYIAIGLGIAVLLTYLPFILIQWDTIWLDPLAIAIAGASVGLPLLALYIVLLFIAIFYKRRYRETWDAFIEKSKLILADNQAAIQKYDELLSNIIPSLRWVYEYKLDVDFYARFCVLATAKLNHHISKLMDRIVAIEKMIGDMETTLPQSRDDQEDEDLQLTMLDYQVSFCSSEKNIRFYAIIPDSPCTTDK